MRDAIRVWIISYNPVVVPARAFIFKWTRRLIRQRDVHKKPGLLVHILHAYSSWYRVVVWHLSSSWKKMANLPRISPITTQGVTLSLTCRWLSLAVALYMWSYFSLRVSRTCQFGGPVGFRVTVQERDFFCQVWVKPTLPRRAAVLDALELYE